MAIEAIFFDAGNTLLFPDMPALLAPLHRQNIFPTLAQWHAAEAFAKRRMDQVILAAGEQKPTGVDAEFWSNFHHHLLSAVSLKDEGVHAELVALARTSANWNQLRPGTLESLAELRKRFCLGIISNADGKIQDVLERVGLGESFDTFTDSGIVGFEKPHPRIFAAALASLNVSAESAAYVGDIYSIDYVGAARAGLTPILMDVSRTYSSNAYARVESVAEVATLFPESTASKMNS